MCTHLTIAMHDRFARRYVSHRSLLNTRTLLAGIGSARLIGAPGFSMKIAVDDQEVDLLTSRLERDFIIEKVEIVAARLHDFA